MSLKPEPICPVPQETVRVAKAAFFVERSKRAFISVTIPAHSVSQQIFSHGRQSSLFPIRLE